MDFFQELKRRNVLRVAAAYALVAWILIEAGSVLLPTFGAPEWFFRIYVLLVGAGFVVSLIFAWVFEITPDGVRLDRNVDTVTHRPPASGKLNLGIIALLVVALGISLTFNLTGMRDRGQPQTGSMQRDSVAVLPFSSLSSDPDNRFFADGIHADLLTRLSETDSLRVISGTSVAEYRGTTKNVRQIGQELGVATIVEGAVQRSGDQVRIMVQLVDTAVDEPIWSDSFDRALTMQNVFAIQTEISSKIAGALRAAMTPDEQERLARTPTTNIEAYAQYVQGRNNLYQRRFETLLEAREQFERAVELDPNFARVYAALAETVMVLFINHSALTPAEAFSVSEAAAQKALELDPELAEAHAVRGLIEYTYWKQSRDDEQLQNAAASFEQAIALNPNLANAYIWYSAVHDALFQVDEAIAMLLTALEIDPLGRIPYLNLPGMYAAQGDSDRAIQIWLKAVALFPDWPAPIEYLAEHLEKLGRLDEALAWYEQARPLASDPMAGSRTISIYRDFGMDKPVEEWLASFPEEHPLFPLGQGYQLFARGEYSAAISVLESLPNIDDMPPDFVFPIMAVSAIFLDDYDTAFEYMSLGNPVLVSDATDVVTPHNVGDAILLAYIQQKRGKTSLASRLLNEADAAVASMPRLGRSGFGIRDVQILVLQGRKEVALDRLRDAIDEGFVSLAGFEIWGLDIDPVLASLRDEPRYKAMQREIAARIDLMRLSFETAAASGDWESLRSRVRSEST